jgi:transcription initiation factor TFIIH subunit 2
MDLQRSWEDVQEDEQGRLVTVSGLDTTAQNERVRAKRSRDDRITESVRRGLIRFLVVAMDASANAAEKDFRPSRLQAAKHGLVKFVSDFYDQNPISQLAFAVTRDRIAEKISGTRIYKC